MSYSVYLFGGILDWFSGDLGTDLTNDSVASQNAFRGRIDELWQDYIGGSHPIWTNINLISGLIAFVCFGCLLLVILKKAESNDNFLSEIDRLFVAIVIIIMLMNNGQLVAESAKVMRSLVVGIDRSVAVSLAGSNKLSQEFRDLLGETKARQVLNDANKACGEFLTIDNEKYIDCMEAIFQKEEDALVANNGNQGFINRLQEFAIGIKDGTLEAGQYLATTVVFSEDRIKLYLAGIAFSLSADIAMFVTALFGPIAIASSLIPVGQKAVYGWITSFYSIGATKVSYTLIVGLMADILTTSNGIGDYLLAFMLGKVVPIVAIALGVGSGVMFFSTLSGIGLNATSNIGIWRSLKAVGSGFKR